MCNNLLIIIFLLVCISVSTYVFAGDNIITVFANKEIGAVNKKIFGNNFIGYDTAPHNPGTPHWYGYADYGAGIWDPKRNKSVREVIDLAKGAGLSVVRFPGGCATKQYNWKDAIGKERMHFIYGIDEFLKTVGEVGAEPVITVSYFTGNEQDAADLVEYLNSPCDGKNPWAEKRAENGHPESYGVKYYEIGVEVWHGDHRDIKSVSPAEYANRYLKYYAAMKAVDSSIKLGAVLYTDDWNRVVLDIIKDKLDFGIIHTYPKPPVWRDELEKMPSDEVFFITLAIPTLEYEVYFDQTLRLLKEKSGIEVPLAITEYNAGLVQDNPVPYRHSLGAALVNAELLRIFLKPGHNILMADYWQFSNSYWGAIKSEDDFMAHDYRRPINYIKRPNFYVYELYNKHFGDILIDTDVKSESYDLTGSVSYIKDVFKKGKGDTANGNLLSGRWNIDKISGVDAYEKDKILEVDFKDPEDFNYYNNSKQAKVQPDTYYKLSGYIRTEELITVGGGVSLVIMDNRRHLKIDSSATTENITGTSDWQYVSAIYKTLSDAESVYVRAMRIGHKGPLKGKAFFKDVKLEKYISPDTNVPFLAVSASKNKEGNKLYLMVVNKNINNSTTSLIELKDFFPQGEIPAWILNGQTIDATNEKKNDNVKISYKELKIKDASFEFTFEPHSLTAFEIKRE